MAAVPSKVKLVLNGNPCPSKIDLKRYTTQCVQFVADFVKVKDGMIQSQCQFPPIPITDDDEVSIFATKFLMDKTVVITNYDIEQHLKFFGTSNKTFPYPIDKSPDSNYRFLVCCFEQ